MCANSCSSNASRCSAGRPPSAPTGTSTTGRSQPTTVGTCTSADTSNRTGRERPIRAPSLPRISCHSEGAGRTRVDCIRAATTQPPTRRTQNTTAPPASLAVSVNPANLAAGTYTENVTIAAAGATGSPAQISVTLVVTGSQPAPIVTAVANAASFQPGLASGAWISVFGTNLSASTYTWQDSD